MGIRYSQIGHQAFLCRRFEETLAFYTHKIGLAQAFTLRNREGAPWLTYITIGGGQFIELFDTPYSSQNLARKRAFEKIRIGVPSVREMRQRLQNGGVSVCSLEAMEPEYFSVLDPEGNEIEFCQREDAAASGIEGITFKCNHPRQMDAFYRDVLGLVPLTAEAESASFGYEVTAGQAVEFLNQEYDTSLKVPQYSPMHFAILVEDIVQAARHLEGKGVTLWKGPQYMGQMYTTPYRNDHPGMCGSHTFYIQDPEGNEIEFMQYTGESLQITCAGT